MTPESNDHEPRKPEEDERWWAMSHKTQIVVIAVAIGLFNCLLVAILAAVFFLRSS